jgi:hypothetical protein
VDVSGNADLLAQSRYGDYPFLACLDYAYTDGDKNSCYQREKVRTDNLKQQASIESGICQANAQHIFESMTLTHTEIDQAYERALAACSRTGAQMLLDVEQHMLRCYVSEGLGSSLRDCLNGSVDAPELNGKSLSTRSGTVSGMLPHLNFALPPPRSTSSSWLRRRMAPIATVRSASSGAERPFAACSPRTFTPASGRLAVISIPTKSPRTSCAMASTQPSNAV